MIFFGVVGYVFVRLLVMILVYVILLIVYGKFEEYLYFFGILIFSGDMLLYILLEIVEFFYWVGFCKLLMINGYGG